MYISIYQIYLKYKYMQYTYICLFFYRTAILMQSKSSKSLKISILCNLIKVLQLRYLKHLCTLTIKNPDL